MRICENSGESGAWGRGKARRERSFKNSRALFGASRESAGANSFGNGEIEVIWNTILVSVSIGSSKNSDRFSKTKFYPSLRGGFCEGILHKPRRMHENP